MSKTTREYCLPLRPGVKTGDKLYFPVGYFEIIEVTVTKIGPVSLEIDKPISKQERRIPLTQVGETCFTSQQEAQRHQDHLNAAAALLDEAGAFQRLLPSDVIKHTSIEEIQLRRAQNQDLFKSAIKLTVAPGDIVKVLWSHVYRKDEVLRRSYGDPLKAGALVRVLLIGPFMGRTTALRVELVDSNPQDVFYLSTGDVGKV